MEQDYQLPILHGSENAVRWADEIRMQHIEDVLKLVEQRSEGYPQQCSAIDHFSVVLQRYVTTGWWIDHRDDDITGHLWYMLRLYLKARHRRLHRNFIPKLLIYSVNSVLTNTPFVDKQPRFILPGRLEALQIHHNAGGKSSIAENVGGVAYGFQTEQEAWDEYNTVAHNLGIHTVKLCFGHPGPGNSYLEEYGYDDVLKRRKPSPDMILEILAELGISAEETTFVGRFPEDRQAAVNAHLDDYIDAAEQFEEVALQEPPILV